MVIVDEAYVDFVEAEDFPKMLPYVKEGRPNVIVLRTFSKAYGLAGLRVGYGYGPSQLIDCLNYLRFRRGTRRELRCVLAFHWRP